MFPEEESPFTAFDSLGNVLDITHTPGDPYS